MQNSKLDQIVSLCKRRGFVFQGSEIYGGFAGTWDLGPLGSELAHNIKELWWNHFVRAHKEMYGLASSALMPEEVWRASGHLKGFADSSVECKKCKKRLRVDEPGNLVPTWELSSQLKCPDCGGKLSSPRKFNLMFKFEGAYLRPEIAQGMFVNFKNVLDAMRPILPFGIAQIGKAFRNEIAPRDFLFRVREFDLMEFEYFVRESEWEKHFEKWRKEIWVWIEKVGIDKNMVHELEVPDGERAHYSKRTIDFEFEYPFGKKELYGLAYRGDYDLKCHMERSGADLMYVDPASGEKFIPHVIEPTFGLGRTILAVLLSAYREDGDRFVLALSPKIAPYKVAVFPLVSNKENLVAKAIEVYEGLRQSKTSGTTNPYSVVFDDRGNIGKRYYAQDEVGTPWCVTIDYQTLEDDTVTVRDRDTGKQERYKIADLDKHFERMLA